MSRLEKTRAGFGAIELIIVAVLVLAVGALTAYAVFGKGKTETTPNPTSEVSTEATASSQPSSITKAEAQEYASGFYIAYIARGGFSDAVLTEYGTDKLRAYVASNQSGADAILCAQNRPLTVVPSTTTLSGDTAKVLTMHSYTSQDLEVLVGLIKVGGKLQVDSVTCPDPATGKQK